MYKMARNHGGQNRTSQMLEMGEIFHEDATFLENPSQYFNSAVFTTDDERKMLPTINSDQIIKGDKIGRHLVIIIH